LNAGAFSDAKVVDAARLVVPVLVDCSESGRFEDLKKKYNVGGYPTVVYADPEGKKTGEMAERDAGPIVREIQSLAKEFPGRPSMWQNSVTGVTETSKKIKRPIAVFIAEEGADLLKVVLKLQKNLSDRKTKFLWVMERGTAKDRGLEGDSGVVVLFPTASEEPLARIPVNAGDKPEVLNKALDEAAKKAKK